MEEIKGLTEKEKGPCFLKESVKGGRRKGHARTQKDEERRSDKCSAVCLSL